MGAAPTGTELVSRSGGGLVRFEQCHNLDLRRLSLRLESQATDVVLSLSGVTNVLVRECSLAAVAATALQLKDVSRLKLHKTTVLNSGAGILRASECRNLRAEGCAFRRNEGEHGFELRDVYDLELDGCEFVENTFKVGLFGVVSSGRIRVADGKFTDNRYRRMAPPGEVVRVEPMPAP